MKKVFSLVLILAILMCITPVVSWKADATNECSRTAPGSWQENYGSGEEISYTKSLDYRGNSDSEYSGWSNTHWEVTDGVLDISGSGYMYESSGGPVGSIPTPPWEDYKDIVHTIIIREGIKNITISAFEGFSNLQNLSLSGTIESIGNNAFADCDKLTSVSIPDSVTYIGYGAFRMCDSLENVRMSGNLSEMPFPAFDECMKLEYNIYDNGKYLGNEINPYVVLMDTTSDAITSIKIHDQTNIIDRMTFHNCSQLTELVIGEKITSIQGWFTDSESLAYNQYDNGYYLGTTCNPYAFLIKAVSTDITSCRIYGSTRDIWQCIF